MVSPVQSAPEGTEWPTTVQTGSLLEPETDPQAAVQQPQNHHPVTSAKTQTQFLMYRIHYIYRGNYNQFVWAREFRSTLILHPHKTITICMTGCQKQSERKQLLCVNRSFKIYFISFSLSNHITGLVTVWIRLCSSIHSRSP